MAWPLSQDYNEAIQSPTSSFSDAELKTGEVVTNALGLPMPRSGNFADVYEFKCPQRKWAIKCFTREIPGIRERYKEISAYLKQAPLPFMVDFSYLEQGIRIRGEWFPILKMQWVEGFTLNDFVRQQLEKPQLLDVLCQIWVKLAARLRDAKMAHCDLQHGNVLMVPGSKASSLAIKLVDYDGMCVPALTLLKSIEVGHPNFQHPQRAREGIYSLEVDRFCHLVIYTALRALIAGGKPLWEKFDNGDNLLFKQSDLEDPSKSPVFQELAKSSDPAVKTLVETLTDAIKKPLDQAPLLPELAAKLPASSIATSVTKTVSAPGPRMQTAEDLFASATAPGEPKLRKKAGGSKTPMLVAAGVGGLLVLGGIVGAIAFMGGGKISDDPGKNEPIVAQGDKDKDKDKDKVEPKGPGENPKEPVKNKDPDPRPDPRPDPKPDPVVRAPGEPKSLRFKGKDNVELANTRDLLDMNGKFTIEMWLRLPDSNQTQHIIGDLARQPEGGRFGGWAMHANRRGPSWHLQTEFSTQGPGWNLGIGIISPSEWHHVAIVNLGDNTQVFVDGKPAAPPLGARRQRLNSPINIFLGTPKELPFQNRTFDGELRGLRISSTARYTEPFKPEQEFAKDADTLVLLDFGSGEARKLADLSGNNHHGTIVGAEWIAKEAVAVRPEPKESPTLRFKGKGNAELADTAGMVDPNGVFTFETWLKLPADKEETQYIAGDLVSDGDVPDKGRGGWSLTANTKNMGQEWNLHVRFGADNGQVWNLHTGATLKPGRWYHAAIVKSEKLQLFVDGQGGGSPSPLRFVKSPLNISLGVPREVTRKPYAFDGELRDVRISSNARYGAENFVPEQHFTKDADTLVLLDIAAGEGDKLADLSGNKHHGTLDGVEWNGKTVVAVRPDPKPDPMPAVVAGKPMVIDKETRRIEGLNAPVRMLALTGDGQRLLGGSFDQTIRLWNFEDGKELARLQGHSSPINCIAMTPDGTRAASVAGSGRNNNGQIEYFDTAIRVWDLDKKQEIHRFEGHKTMARVVAISADKKLALSADINRVMKLWELETGKELQTSTQPNFVQCLAFTPDGSRAVIASANLLIVWDIKRWQEVRRFQQKTFINSNSLAVSPDGKRAAVGMGGVGLINGKRASQDCQVSVVNLDDSKPSVDLEHPYPICCLAFSSEGSYLLAGVMGYETVENRTIPKDMSLRLWDLESRKEVIRLEGHGNQVMSAVLTPNGAAITASMDNSVRIWKLPKLDNLIAKIGDPKPDPTPDPKAAVKPPDPPAKAAVPDAAAQKEAEAALLEEFKDDLAKTKTTVEQAAAAAKLLAAVNPKRKQEERFVLAKLARDLAAKAGDPAGVIKAIDATARDFDVDAAAMKLEALKAMPIASPTAGRNLAETCLTLVDEALADDEFDFALYLIPIAEPAAKKANNTSLSKRVVASGKRIKELQQEFEQVKAAFATLEKTPDDPAASLAAGKYLCLSKGNWDKGLPLLENCSDPAFKALAKREKRQAADPEDQSAIGDAYWDLSLKDAGPGKQQLMRRAFHWYDQAVVGLSGATLVRIEKRMKQATDLMPDLKPPEVVGLIRTFDGHSDEVRCVALSRDGRRGLSGCTDGSVRVWDIHNGKELHRFDRISNDARSIMFSSDGRRAIVGTSNGLSTLDLERKRIDRGMGFGGVGGGLDFLLLTTDSQVLFSRGGMLWQIGEDMTNARGKSLSRNFACVASSLDGRIMATGSPDGVVQIYAISEAKSAPTRQFTAAQGPLGAIAMSPDGRYLATAGAGDRLVRVWDTATGKIRTTFKGHAARVHAIAFSRDGKRILSGGEDRTARLWDLTGKELSKLEGHTGEVLGVALSLDGRRALTASADKSVRVWGLPR